MENLPASVSIKILNKIHNSADLARCRVVSKTLNSPSYETQTLNIFCSFDCYQKSRDPQTKALITPFKTIVKNLLLQSKSLESVSIGFKNCFPLEKGNIELDDLYLTSVDFVSEWLPKIVRGWRSLSISDFLVQAYPRRSDVKNLGTISRM